MSGALCHVGCVLLGASSLLAAAPSLSDLRFGTNQFQFRLSGEAGQAYIVQAARDLTNWSGVLTNVLETNTSVFSLPGTNTSGFFRAKVATPLFNHAVLAYIFGPGRHAVVSDSFDSAEPRFSTAAGQYDPAKRRDGGDIVSERGLTITANSQIAGKVWTDPDTGVSPGPSASVGSLAWVDSGQTGVQPGYWSTNRQHNWPGIRLPTASPFPPVGGNVDGEFYNFVFANGDYRLSALNLSGGKILVIGKCTLVVDSRLSLSSNAVVRFQSRDSTLHLYVLAPDVQFGPQMQGVMNANQFIMFGLATCTSIDLNAPSFTGVIYAPNALCALNTTSVVGACGARAVTLNRPVSFHFDENLKRVGGYH